MRWKLIVIVSFAATVLACGLWSVLVIGVYGSAQALARSSWILVSSLIIPVAVSTYAGMFVYRHTARRRKTQAAFAIVFALLLTLGTYLATAQVFPSRLMISRNHSSGAVR